jgi:general secretion pathway protein L
VEFVRRRRGRLAPLGRFVLQGAGLAAARAALTRHRAGGRVVLAPAPHAVLVREVALPLAAERDLATVLRYEWDRLTPFAPEEVFWGWRAGRRDHAHGVLTVWLALLPKAWMQPALEGLQALGLTPAAAEVPLADGAVCPIALRPEDAAASARGRRARRLAGGLCAALAVAVLAVPPIRQALALAAVQAELDRLAPRMTEVEALRRRIAASASGADAVAAARARAGATLAALATLTEALPDDTWLSSLALHQRKLTLEGQSAAATKLIATLSATPRIRNPTFAAPVVRNDVQADIFTIQAEVGP